MDNHHTFENTPEVLNHIFMKSLYSPLQLTFVILFLAALTANAQEQKFDKEYKLWPNGAPGSNPKNWPEPNYKESWPRKDTTATHVTDPTIRVYRPTKEKNTGVAVIINPGGGYRVLEMGHEGYKVAEKLQDLGITAVVLKYRHYDVSAARQDGQRAIRFVRSKAKEWGIDEHKIGIGGFSAGGHLALNAAATLKPKEDWTPDAIDLFSRPVLILGVFQMKFLITNRSNDAS